MMKPLTPEQIESFASRKGAKRVAVENFLMSCHFDDDPIAAAENARTDAASYRWNYATLGAILDGISLSAKEETK